MIDGDHKRGKEEINFFNPLDPPKEGRAKAQFESVEVVLGGMIAIALKYGEGQAINGAISALLNFLVNLITQLPEANRPVAAKLFADTLRDAAGKLETLAAEGTKQ